MVSNLNVRIQSARDAKLNWETNNPVLLDGEIGIVWGEHEDTSQAALKIGNGADAYNTLPFFTDDSKVSVDQLGAPYGVATLDADGKIPMSQLPEGIFIERSDEDSEAIEPANNSSGEVAPQNDTYFVDYTIIEKVPSQVGTVQANGTRQMPEWDSLDLEAFILSGTIEAVEPGEYTAIFTPAPGYTWEDGTIAGIPVKWVIE